jgi:putative transposase|tara:strand:- start:236 stop:700 length:465 start_codon:yes stop_codon:yes gene_type:complete
MDAGFCIEALNEALTRHGKPEIFNTDQGSQFTSFEFTGLLKVAEITISMDGRGRCMDNIFIERLCRSLKYEAGYLHELTDGFKAERVIGEWIDFYNTERPHSAHDGQTPAEAYGAGQPMDMMHKADASPTYPQGLARRFGPAQQQDVINRILAA